VNYKRAGAVLGIVLALILAVLVRALPAQASPTQDGQNKTAIMKGATTLPDRSNRDSGAPFPVPVHGRGVWWLAGSLGLLVGLTITTIAVADAPPPINSYAAQVAVLDADASPTLVPHGLPFTPTKILSNVMVAGAATAVTAVTVDATNISISHATGATTGFTIYVQCARPTTNNAP
jgi:hypothetical protein